MCIIKQVYNYLRLKKHWNTYIIAKEKSKYKFSDGGNPNQEPVTGLMKKRFRRLLIFCRYQKLKKRPLVKKILMTGTYENFVALAMIGLVVGSLISSLHFYSVLYHGQALFSWSFMIRLPVLVTMTSSLAFSQRGRCFLLLSPLQMFSNSGAHFMTGQLMVLTAIGPLANLYHNLNVLQESGSCQQRAVMAAAADIADILFGPFSSFKQAAAHITKGIREMVAKLVRIFAAFKRTVMVVASAFQDATRWINSKMSRCRTTVGTTYDHCVEAFSWMHDECRVKVPIVLAGVCTVTGLANNLCASVKPGEYLCDLIAYSVDPLVTTINQRIRRLWDRAYTLFYFDVNVHHEYNIADNSKSIADVLKQKMLAALNSQIFMLTANLVYGLLGVFLELYFLWSMFRYYRLYLRREEFDNYFVSDNLRDIDIQETLKGEKSIFPLKRLEKRKYVKITSISLTKKEVKIYSYSLLVIAKSVLYLLIIGLDYVLYYIIDKARVFMIATMQTFSTRTEIVIEGSGFIAELSRRVVRALNYMNSDFFQTHLMPCVPNPKQPNQFIAIQIYFWLFMFWFAWLTKPYTLRGRHVLMDWYFPDKAEKRAVWLYKKISLRRETFMSMVRVKLRTKYGRDVRRTVSVVDLLRARWPWLTYVLGKGMMAEQCSVCGHLRPPLYRCPTLDCTAVFCDDCYINVHGVCCLCTQPMMISDFKNINLKTQEAVVSLQIEEDEECFEVSDEKVSKIEFSYQGGRARAWDPNILQKRFESIEKRVARRLEIY